MRPRVSHGASHRKATKPFRLRLPGKDCAVGLSSTSGTSLLPIWPVFLGRSRRASYHPGSIASSNPCLEIFGDRADDPSWEPPGCQKPAGSEDKKSATDNRSDRNLNEKESRETDEDYCSLSGQKSTRHAVANEEGDCNRENTKIVK